MKQRKGVGKIVFKTSSCKKSKVSQLSEVNIQRQRQDNILLGLCCIKPHCEGYIVATFSNYASFISELVQDKYAKQTF